MPWSEQQIVAAAPDTASVAAGRKLAVPGPWSETGANDSTALGPLSGQRQHALPGQRRPPGPRLPLHLPESQIPVQTRDRTPSSLVGRRRGRSRAAGTAEFAQTWAEQREKRTRSRAASPDEAPADPEAQARRQTERVAKMDAGIAEFTLWLTDLARAGLADARGRNRAWWDGVAARLVTPSSRRSPSRCVMPAGRSVPASETASSSSSSVAGGCSHERGWFATPYPQPNGPICEQRSAGPCRRPRCARERWSPAPGWSRARTATSRDACSSSAPGSAARTAST